MGRGIGICAALVALLGREAWAAEKVDNLAGWLDTISQVSVTLDGDAPQNLRGQFETLVNVRARNELSSLTFETKTFPDAYKQFGERLDAPQLKRRAGLNCLVWVVKAQVAAAHLVECKIWGYGNYLLGQDISSRYLGVAGTQTLEKGLEDSIRATITALAGELFKAREMNTKLSVSAPVNTPSTPKQPDSKFESTGKSRPKSEIPPP